MYSCRGVYIVGEDCIWFSSFVFCSRDWSSDFLWVCLGAEKAVWARAPGMLFPPRPQGLGTPFLSLQAPPFLAPPLPLCNTAPFFYGGGVSLSLQGFSSVTRPTFCSDTAGPLVNLQCTPIVTEYFVFVQSGEFPASCMCQGVCSWLPAGCLFTWHILCRRFANCIKPKCSHKDFWGHRGSWRKNVFTSYLLNVLNKCDSWIKCFVFEQRKKTWRLPSRG